MYDSRKDCFGRAIETGDFYYSTGWGGTYVLLYVKKTSGKKFKAIRYGNSDNRWNKELLDPNSNVDCKVCYEWPDDAKGVRILNPVKELPPVVVKRLIETFEKTQDYKRSDVSVKDKLDKIKTEIANADGIFDHGLLGS